MKILSIHNSYQIRGGEDKSTASERKLLQDNGVEVFTYDKSNHEITGFLKYISVIFFFFNFKSYFDVKRIIKEQEIDLVHVQNFFPLVSPSVFFAAKSLNKPTLMTVRNYRLFCSNGLLYRDNKVCTKCLKNKFNYHAISYKCYRGSRIESFIISTLFWFYDFIGTWKKIDKFVLLTNFQKELFKQNGFHESQLVVKGNFVSDEIDSSKDKKKQLLFVGRISEEKGILDLIHIWTRVAENSDYRLVVAGDGPLLNMVKEIAEKNEKIKVLGQVEYNQVYNLMAESTALVFTSNWFEGMPRTIIESYASGTPVISNDIGAMKSMVIEGSTGYKYTSLNELEDILKRLLDNPDVFLNMKERCLTEFRDKYEKQKNLEALILIYSSLLNGESCEENNKRT